MNNKEFGAKLRALREQAGLSQGELASKVGVSFTYLSKIEGGVKPPPREKVILKLAEALNADKDELLILAGKIPSDIAQILKNREAMQYLKPGRKRKQTDMADERVSFSLRLKELRERAGLSQRELAEKVGVNFTYLSKIEGGVLPPPSEKVIVKLAETLNVDKDELLTLAGKLSADIAQMLKDQGTLQYLRASHNKEKVSAAEHKGGINIFKNLVNFKNLSRVALPVMLVLAVATSLWYASPTPVSALTFEYPSLPSSGTLGASYTFQVKVNVEEGNDILPIYSMDLEIRNAASPTTYKATATALPMPASGLTSSSKSYTTSQTGGGAVTVSASSAYGWAWGTPPGNRQGYGYTDPDGMGYHFLGSTMGYGYGYNNNAGDTSITLTVTWTPPGTWPTGNYNIKTIVYGDSAKTKKWSDISNNFSLTNAGGIIPGPGPSPTPRAPVVIKPGVVDVSKVVNSEGKFTQTVTTKSEDVKVTIVVPVDTIGKTKDNKPISQISVTPISDPPAPPANANIIGLAYDLGPDGATFAPPIDITFSYDPADVPEGASEADLGVAVYDETTGEWVELENVIVDTETHTITISRSSFSKYAIIARVTPEQPVVTPPEETPAPAAFSISNLAIQPPTVQSGKPVSVSVLVTNTGGTGGSYTAVLKINGVQEAEKSVTMAAGSSQTITFSVTREAAGSYSITVADLSGSFTVTAAAPVTPPTEVPPAEVPRPSTAWWVWLIIGLAAVVVIGVIAWIVMRRRTA